MTDAEKLSEAKEFTKLYKRMLQQQEDMKVGDDYYLVESEWYLKWRSYVNYDQLEGGDQVNKDTANIPDEHPGPIKNKSLIDTEPHKAFNKLQSHAMFMNVWLKNGLKENLQYIFVDKDTWEFLHSRYKGFKL